MHALFNALNRDAKEMTVSDVLVGLHQEFGQVALRYFEPESAAVELVAQIRGSAKAHTYSLSNLSELGPRDLERGGTGVSFQGLPMSASLKTIMAAAELYFQSHQHHSIGLRDFMQALGEDSESITFFQAHGIKFRKETGSIEAEATKRDEAGAIPLEEVIKLFEHWKATSARVMYSFRSGAGSIGASLGALFNITGKVRMVTEPHSQVSIDAENATETSCLLDLRGSLTKREAWNPLPGDARMELNPPIRLEIRLATGDRCTIILVPSFAYGTDQGPETP